MEAASSAMPLPRFEYVPTMSCEPSHRYDPAMSPHHSERMREALTLMEIGGHGKRIASAPLGPTHTLATVQAMGRRRSQPRLRRRAQHTLDEPPGLKNKSRPRGLEREHGLVRPEPRDKECSTEVVATIAGGYAEGITRSAWKAQLRNAHQVLTADQGTQVTVLTMVFGRGEAPRFTSSHNDPILIDRGSSMDIITWDCLKKLTYSGRHIFPLVHPILGFGGLEVNPTGIIRLPLRFGDKVKAKNLEVDFLIVDVPTVYNIILGQPTPHQVKAVGRPAKKGDYDMTKQKIKTQKGYTSGSPSLSLALSSVAPWLSSSGVPASLSRGVISLFLRSSLSTKGGLNSTYSGPRSRLPHVKLGSGSLGPCGRTQHSPRDPDDNLIARPWPPSQPQQLPQPRFWRAPRPTCAAGLSSQPPALLSFASVSPSDICRERNIKGDERRTKKKRREEEGTLYTLAIATSSSITLNGSEEPKGARSQDLVKCSFAAAICSGVASPTLKGINFSCACSVHNKKESEKFLRIRRPTAAKKKSFSKCFNLGSQFKGSLSLDLLRFFFGPRTDSVTWAMNLGRGLGRPSSRM
ncbi:hypothetical protein Cgig2_025659 [Carnegiea gigantea]|uniref:Uncharacterized protein n=1 Tax=Carnegiea gigantea TaxID=171969 RepID=A0A9Q1JT18_9CARY|nr:hypothetical protein Cgig2_025659 [Carnegiea gigantea]